MPYVSPDVSGLYFAETFDGDVAWRNNDQGSLNCLLRDQEMQIYGHFEEFPIHNRLFGLVIQ